VIDHIQPTRRFLAARAHEHGVAKSYRNKNCNQKTAGRESNQRHTTMRCAVIGRAPRPLDGLVVTENDLTFTHVQNRCLRRRVALN